MLPIEDCMDGRGRDALQCACVYVVRVQIQQKNLLEAVFVRGDTGEKIKATRLVVAQVRCK